MEKIDTLKLGMRYDDFKSVEQFDTRLATIELAEKLNEVIDHLNNTEPYNREALLDCLISNKCDKLTARDLVLWGEEQARKRLESDS